MNARTARVSGLTVTAALLAALTVGTVQAAPPRSLLRVETRYQQAPGKAEFPRADVLFLEDDIGFSLRADGSTVYTEHDAIKILTERGAESYGQLVRQYRSGQETLQVEMARTVQADGSVREVPLPALRDQAILPDSALYADQRRLQVIFPEVKPGCVVEFRLRTTRQPRPGNQFWATSYVQNPDPILSSTFTARMPEGVEVRWAAPGLSPARPAETREEGDRVLRWAVKDSPALQPEPAMPDLDFLLRRVEVTSFADWPALADWFSPRWRTAVQDREGLAIKASGLIPSTGSNRDRVRPVLAWVARGREVLDGLDPWEPHPARDLPSARVLSPVDAAVLITAMLKHAGIEARPVLVAAVPLADLQKELPDPEHVSRLLLAVPNGDGSDSWVDPTAPGELLDSPPAGAQGVAALRLVGDKGELFTTPISPGDDNLRGLQMDVRVERDGRAEVNLDLAAHGLAATLWASLVRELEGTSPDRRELLLDRLFDQFALGFAANGKIYSYYFPTRVPDGPLKLSAMVSFPRMAVPDAESGGLAMPLPMFGGDRLAAFAGAGPRRYPVRFDHPFRDDVRVHVRLPEGSTVKSLPATTSVESPVGTFFATTRSQGNDVYYYSRLVVKSPWISPEAFPALQKLADAEAAILESPLLFTPPPAAQAAPNVDLQKPAEPEK